MTEAKLYQIHEDWYLARNLRDAVREAHSLTGELIRELLENTREVEDHELDELDFMPDPYNDSETKITFRARLAEVIAAKEPLPMCFACRDC